jgi:pyruvate/2-oxoglutarate dehydrogenase complex dihydrolipoamide dehydrogenase (E3) component/uncharacterized membrane protein YdjX (TVP38/TMEM64 family)
MSPKKAVLLAAIAAALVLFFASGLHHHLDLAGLRRGHEVLLAWWTGRPLLTAAGFFALYVLATALSLPGAVVLTLAAGAVFGLAWGTVIVSFASSLGALLAFWSARFLLRDAVRARFGARLAEIDRGLARDGWLYVVTLRLVPVIPFFVINLAMGLTGLRARTFYWASQLGMLAGTVVYVNAGTQLAQLDSLRGILGAPVLASFAVLAALPWLGRGIAGWLARRKVYARWRGARPRRFDRNLVVIGAGAAGLVSAYVGAALKARVTLIEAHKLGGDCLNYGCIPSKALIRSARLAHQMRHADAYGLDAAVPTVRFSAVMARVREVIRRIEPHDSAERYESLGVEVLQGHARIVDPWTVEITPANGRPWRLTTRSIVIATGARPVVPPIPGLREAGCLTSDTLWSHLEQLDAPPRRLLVLGGGPIGCELAQALARLGAGVTQVEMGERLLAREDPEVSQAVARSLEADGVRVLAGHQALRCEARDGGHVLVALHEGRQVEIAFDAILCAVGREARLEGYGLEALGIPVGRTVDTNGYLQTLYPNIFAAGDVAGPFQFTHAAAHQAWHAAVNALLGHWRSFRVDYSVIPSATFVDPEVARVGLNEQEARRAGVAFEVTRYGIDDLDRAIADGEARGWIKVLTVPGRDRILGVTIVGSHAAEMLAEYVFAMKHGHGLGRILGTIHTYPTWSEANKYAAGEWRRAHQPAALLRLLASYHRWRRGQA